MQYRSNTKSYSKDQNSPIKKFLVVRTNQNVLCLLDIFIIIKCDNWKDSFLHWETITKDC